jgi:hypothetical protein
LKEEKTYSDASVWTETIFHKNVAALHTSTYPAFDNLRASEVASSTSKLLRQTEILAADNQRFKTFTGVAAVKAESK